MQFLVGCLLCNNNAFLPKDAPEIKTGSPYTLNSQNRGGGNTSDYGEIITDENGLSYRDVRDTNWNTAFGELSQSYHREYVPNKAYKKLLNVDLNLYTTNTHLSKQTV